MSTRQKALIFFFIAAVTATMGAVGHMLVSIPAISAHFYSEPNLYWYHRLIASLILGSSGLYFGASVLWIALLLAKSKDAGKRVAGKYLLVLSLFPQLASFIALPTLTPSDWPHMITHGVIMVSILVGLILSKKA